MIITDYDYLLLLILMINRDWTIKKRIIYKLNVKIGCNIYLFDN